MREIRIYDGDFPTHDQILSGDPNAVFPKQTWLTKVGPNELAVRYKDFKTGLPRNPAGEHVTSSEICRVFDTLEEARQDSRKIVNEHWSVRCFIYDHRGALVEALSNNREVGKFAAWMYGGIILWGTGLAAAGMGLGWLLLKTLLLLTTPQGDTQKFFTAYGWVVIVVGGPILAIAGCAVYLLIRAQRKHSRMQRNLDVLLSPEDKERFGEINTLHGSSDPAERERFLKLSAQYRERVREAL